MTNIYTNPTITTSNINLQQITNDLQQAPINVPLSAFPAVITANANDNPPTTYNITITFQAVFDVTPYITAINTYFSTYTFQETPFTDVTNTGTVGTFTTINATQTANRTHQIPNITNDTFLFQNAQQSLTNKILNASCNTITISTSQLSDVSYTLPIVTGNVLQYNGSRWINTSSIGPIGELNINSSWKLIQNNPQIDTNYTTPTLLLQKYEGTSWLTNAVFM